MASILVVEDDPFAGDLLTRLLRQAGHHITLARDGHTAIRTLDHLRPDVILLDLMMPDVDGVTVLGRVRRDPSLRNLCVFVLSALSEGPEVDQVTALGIQGYFVKGSPFYPQLLAALASCPPQA